jgi:hypothetical protein
MIRASGEKLPTKGASDEVRILSEGIADMIARPVKVK